MATAQIFSTEKTFPISEEIGAIADRSLQPRDNFRNFHAFGRVILGVSLRSNFACPYRILLMSRSALAVVASVGFFVTIVHAGEIGWIEQFSLSTDREAALQQLIPGTEDYYYYHCLHYQNKTQWEKAEEMLAAWIRRHQHTPRVIEIENRQALLRYEQDHKRALDLIRNRLALQFLHERERLDPAANLPNALDQLLLDRKRLIDLAFQRNSSTVEGFEDAALDWLLDTELTPDQRRHLLSRLRRPDYPRLVELVAADLEYLNSGGFGQFEIHRQLLLVQLDELLELKPGLKNDQNFVFAYISKLHPSADSNWRQDREELRAFLDRLWAFVSTLDPAFNSLKAHVLYHRLVLDRSQGVFDLERFVMYLKLPRDVIYAAPVLRDSLEQRVHPANLNADYAGVTGLTLIGGDEPIVRAYLAHFLVEAENYDQFKPYIEETYLRQLFAEVKIVNGLGDAERWASLLPPEQYRALRERIDIDFAETNKTEYGPTEAVGLDVFIKNVDTLLVKIFEINTQSYYRQYAREASTDIDLDGLVANHEQTYNYNESPLRRVKRHFEFPMLKDRGVYVIDFIGNGMSSRAVVRKGKLEYLVRTSAAGQIFTIIDEQRQPVLNATLWLAGTLYEPTKDGVITTPFNNEPGSRPIVLTSGRFSTLSRFDQQAENYSLTAGIYVDRETLLGRRKAHVLIRPSLSIDGTPISVKSLEEVRLVVTSTDLDGVPTTKTIEKFELFDGKESVFDFQVPPRLSTIQFSLLAKIKVLSRNEKIELSTTRTYAVNEIDKTERIEDVHLVHAGGEYFIDLLGKSGESQPHRAVNVTLKVRGFVEQVHATLATNKDGRVSLGPLSNVETVSASGPDGAARTWPIRRDSHNYRSAKHGEAGTTIEIPYMGTAKQVDQTILSLLELRGETFVRDRASAASIENGLLKIADLPPGDYSLLLKEQGVTIRLRLTEGVRRHGYVLGDYRQLELRAAKPPQLAPVKADGNKVRIQILNPTQSIRVHVFATRFEPAFGAFTNLGNVVTREPYLRLLTDPESLYVVGRNIGDEYRYVIERRYSKKFPGNMLNRPGLLLNPWVVHDTETGEQEARQGGDFAPSPATPESAVAGGEASEVSREGQLTDAANLDFLAETSIVLANLVPNDKGLIEFDRKDLGPHQDLVIVAVDGEETASGHFSLPEIEPKHLDLRLAEGLDPNKHYMRQQKISVLGKDEALVFANITSTKFEIYDSLAKVFALYAALNNDPRLPEFRFVTEWQKLDPAKKRELHSKYASHEMHFFIQQKDPDFFDTVVKPYLANKLDKTFFDKWLIGADLSEYLEPWRFERLNTLEKILLGRRIEGQRPVVGRYVQEQFELLPPQDNRYELLFRTALLGRAFEEENSGLTDKLSAMEDTTTNGPFGLAGMPAASGRFGGGIAGGGLEGARGGAKRLPSLGKAMEPTSEEAAQEFSRADRRRSLSSFGVEWKDGAETDFFAENDLQLRENLQQLYQRLDKTKEWAENNYYHVLNVQQSPDLIPRGAFWKDLATHDPATPFRTEHIADATHTFAEMLMALALIDVPFEAGEHQVDLKGAELTLTAASPLVVYHEEVLPAKAAEGNAPVLVSQNFFRSDDRYKQIDNQRIDKFVSDEFLVDVVYGCQVVVTNPTSTPRKLDVLLQVPVGAIPVRNGELTKGVRLTLEAYSTQVVEYRFYFPTAGDFTHYPVQVSDNEQVLASVEPATFHVVVDPSNVDTTSWAYVSQRGSDDEVLAYLEMNNIQRIDLDRIAFRMKDKAFFEKVIKLLDGRHVYNHTLWSYGVYHNVPAAIRQFLKHADDFVAQTGEFLRSPLLVIDPVVRKTYEHLEYAPLVNARVNRLGREREILNDRFLAQYQRLLKILSYQRQLGDEELMEVLYYLLLQDRVEESLAVYSRINPDSLGTKLQHDYFTAYLDFYRSEPDAAKQIAAKYVEYPVERWREAFANVAAQADEIVKNEVVVVDDEDCDQNQGLRAARTPSFTFLVEAQTVKIDYQNLASVRVHYYLMDVELLFSRNPFVQDHGGRFSSIRPNQTAVVELPQDKRHFEFSLPNELNGRNVLIEIEGAGKTQARVAYANSLLVQVIENYGQLQVTDTASKPLPKVYVKAFARMRDSSVRFYKDGYTDLRGRFDYSSLNTNDLEQVDRFSILVMSEEHGALIREASRPPQ